MVKSGNLKELFLKKKKRTQILLKEDVWYSPTIRRVEVNELQLVCHRFLGGRALLEGRLHLLPVFGRAGALREWALQTDARQLR